MKQAFELLERGKQLAMTTVNVFIILWVYLLENLCAQKDAHLQQGGAAVAGAKKPGDLGRGPDAKGKHGRTLRQCRVGNAVLCTQG